LVTSAADLGSNRHPEVEIMSDGDRGQLESLFRVHGFSDYKWIDPKEIVVAHWVRMKCRFGCNEYGHNACCPPNTPPVAECLAFFREYREAAVFHFSTTVDEPEDRFEWTHGINSKLIELERVVFMAGNPKAFMLFMDSCNLCDDCSAGRADCTNPRKARPSPEAMAVDVFATVRKIGYPVEVLSDYDQPMNRYAMLLVR
jgi:predicted metal-binding protein